LGIVYDTFYNNIMIKFQIAFDFGVSLANNHIDNKFMLSDN